MDENQRLTHQRSNGIKDGYWSPNKKEELVERLAAYENTGLMPDEISVPKYGQWISVKDRLPDVDLEVIVIYWDDEGYGYITTAIYEDGDLSVYDSMWDWMSGCYFPTNDLGDPVIPEGWWECRHFSDRWEDEMGILIDADVTHWMPLPEPPEGSAT